MRISDRTYERLKRLQALSGGLAIGLFLLAHFAVNFTAVGGPQTFDRAVAALEGWPLVTAVEIVAIALPLLVHVALGIFLGTTAQAVRGHCGYPRRWMRPLQRGTGVFLVVFVLYHVWGTRFSPAVRADQPDLFLHMSELLGHSGVFVFYTLGVLVACGHLAIGLIDFARRFGLVPHPAAERWVARLALVAFALLSLVGLNALLAFVSPPARWLERGPEHRYVHRPVPGSETDDEQPTRAAVEAAVEDAPTERP